ncbi:MAG: ABC transporter ATP-binding protein/permease [Rikenellaceae bacterium]|jgi:ABC-type multidrug transport system fused ATPase/permease subunit|nr:ABC transporter ATP-binding protein/permease [Rikenellaceae bacterium]
MGFAIFRLIPREYRAKGVLVVVTSVVRALLDVVGLAAMIAILPLIVAPGGFAENRWLSGIYNALGFTSERAFVWVACGVIVVVIALKGVLSLLISRFQNVYMMSLYRHYSQAMLEGYYRRGLLYIKGRNTAKLAFEVNITSMNYVQGVLMSVASMTSDGVLIVLMFASITLYSPVAALFVFAVFTPLAFIYIQSIRGRLQDYGKRENELRRKQARIVQETFKGYSEIEITGAFPQLDAEFEQGLQKISWLRRTVLVIQQTPTVIIETGIALALVVLVFLRVDAILLGVFGVVALRMLPAVKNMITSWITIRNNRYAEGIVEEAMRVLPSAPDSDSTERMPFRNTIVVDDVSFGFEGSASPVIDHLSLTIRKGERVGIKGASGGGKTTLFNLLLGFYPPLSGEILVDGVSIEGANRRKWQNIVGYVPQEVFVMDSTIAENVAMGGEIDRERVLRAIETARLGDFVAGLADGIDTHIGEGGARLSGGQKQRLGIARALYTRAEVLFFDEATSALDSATESEINASIRELSDTHSEITIIIIAHRESSLSFCDRIIEIGR